MTVTYLVIPLFFIALILFVSWPLLSEVEAPKEPAPAVQASKRKKG